MGVNKGLVWADLVDKVSRDAKRALKVIATRLVPYYVLQVMLFLNVEPHVLCRVTKNGELNVRNPKVVYDDRSEYSVTHAASP